MRHSIICCGILAAAILAGTAPQAAPASTHPAPGLDQLEPGEDLPGGAATSRKRVNKDAFSQSSANMPFERELNFKVGNGFFKRVWVSAPASTTSADGLGPLYNARSCQRCHLKDGRGHPPEGNYPDDDAVSMFLRLSVPPQNEAQAADLAAGRIAVVPEPTYGGQLQDFAIPGLVAEGRMAIRYSDRPVSFADGETVVLRVPTYSVTDLGFGPLHPQTMLSPRVAPPMIGLGLLEAIEAEDILAALDPDDRDGDGISGRANRVWDPETGAPALGRFGWKAGAPTIKAQSAGAFAGDMGISSPLAAAPWGDCSEAEADCRNAPHGINHDGSGYEADEKVLDLVTFYARNLAVPRRRNAETPQVLAGRQLFRDSGCAACHRPNFTTGQRAEMPEQSGQRIWPYTDLLLHDMGDGLADNRPEGLADGREWRTAPLWGIGLTRIVNGHTYFLHDGRARNLMEAVLWHDGEAEASRKAVQALGKAERDALIAFLESL